MFPPPSAKKRVSKVPGNPLPVPLIGWGNIPPARSPVYCAEFLDGEIVVSEPSHVNKLYSNGFFGQGMLSSKGVDYEILSKKVTQSQMQRKLEWRSLETTGQSSTSQSLQQSLPKRTRMNTPQSHRRDNTQRKGTRDNERTLIPKKYIYVIPDNSPTDDRDDNDDDGESTEGAALTVDPFPVDECLTLLPEEAVYLSFGLGCLVVTDEQGCQMNIDALWRRLIASEPELPYRYVVYHQMRAAGWVVRSAERYAADYMLYAAGPAYYHSQYLVRVEAYDATSKRALTRRHTTYACQLNAMDRMAANVQKMYMLAVVLRPPCLQSLDNLLTCCQELCVEQLPFARLNLDNADNCDAKEA